METNTLEMKVMNVPVKEPKPIEEVFSTLDWKNLEFSNTDAIVNIGTLFSGIGAIEHAFQRLGLKYKIQFAGDIDINCKKSYFANYEIEEEDWHNDVCSFDATKYKGKVDLVVGGAPCQAFSMVGKRKGFDDTRGTLFREFARVVKECEPQIFIFENVRGLLSHDKGNTWKVIYNTFKDYLAYDIHFKVLNSRNYGIPQNRERVYCIGFKKQTEFKFPKPIELEYKMLDFLEDTVDSKFYLPEKGVKFVTAEKNLKKRYTQINGNVALCQKRNQQFNWHGDFICNEDYDEFLFPNKIVDEKYYLSETVKNFVLSPGSKNYKTVVGTDLEVARPLLQSMHKMHRSGVDNYVTHNKGRIRKLTPRECLRLMGFKDSFKIVCCDTQMYRQAGNSIVVDVFIAILKQLDITKYGH